MTSVGGWGSGGGDASGGVGPGGFGLSSGLGSAPKPASSGGGLWGSITDPLGIVSGVKNMATGLASSFGGIAAHGISGLVDTGYNLASGLTGGDTNWGQVGTEFRQAGQGVGDVGTGLVLGVEDLGVDAGNLIGAQNVMRDDVFRPFNKFVAGKGEHGDGTWNAIISPEMGERLDSGGKGFGPDGFVKMAQTQGIGAAALNTAAEAAIVAAPVAGAASAFAADAADAASIAETAGAAERAASYNARAGALEKVATAAQNVHTVGRFGYNPIGAAGALADSTFGSMADNALADSAEEGTTPRSAKLYRRAQVLGQVADSPFKFVGMNAADLLSAMRERAYPTVLPPEGEGGTTAPPEAPVAPEGTQAPQTTPEELNLIRDAQDPTTAAAEAMGSTEAPDDRTELQKASDEAAAALEAKPPKPTAPESPLMRRLYNGGHNAEVMWTSDISRAESYRNTGVGENAGKVRYVDVPISEAEAMRTAEGSDAYIKATQGEGNNNQPNTATDYYLGERPELAAKAREHIAQPEVPEQPTGEATPAPKGEAKIEPATYKVADPSMSPEEAKAADEAARAETAAAREKATPGIYVYDALGQRLNGPTPLWAQAVADKIPESINRQLAKLAPFINEVRMRNLQRALMQTLETSQQRTRSTEGMRTLEAAAQEILSKSLGRSAASDIIGQEIFARLYGETALAEWLKNNNSIMPSDAQAAALENAARGRWPGMTDEMWANMTPEDRVEMTKRLNEATKFFKEESIRTRDTLLASRFGAKGLEHVILDPNDIGMTSEQMRLYKRSVRDQRFAAKALERVPGERTRAEAKAAVAEATGERKWGVVDRLRAKLGLTEATTEELYRGIPDGMRNNAQAVISQAVAAIGAGAEHVVIDPATGSIVPPSEGIFVPMALQGAGVPEADWATQGEEAVRNSILFPTSKDGGTYDPVRLFTGMDARVVLARTTAADGTTMIQPVLGMHSINGEAIVPWQARILGDAFEQHAGFNFADQSSVPFSDTPMQQAVASHYIGDVLDPNSRLSKWASEKAAVAQKLGTIGPEQLNAEITALLTLDQVMAQRPNGWKTGDIFNSETSIGQGEPRLPHLLQTIMPELSTEEHFVQAMTQNDFDSVSKMLSWYYTSHDAIESMWRLNEDGSEKMTPFGRSAADTFYDLVAVTSVMASPTQNLGRALAGYANLDDFLTSRKDAIENASKVMDEVMGNKRAEVAYVKNVGVTRESYVEKYPQLPGERKATFERRIDKNIEREVPKGEGGTAVSRRWLDSPVARDLSAQTSMTTSPKYRIIDILMGKLDLSKATAEDLGAQPEFWMEGGGTNWSDRSLAPSAVLHHADLLGIEGKPVDDYQQWAVDHENLKAARMVREDKHWVQPITDSEDVQRQRAERDAERDGVPLLGGRKVSPQEYQDLVNDGRANVEQRLANSTPHVLDTPELRAQLYDSIIRPYLETPPTDEEWPGATMDSHTGVAIPPDYNGDTYAVTARLRREATGKPTMKEVFSKTTTPTEAEFNRLYTKALKEYKQVLDSEGGHLGIFWNKDTNRIEFDPVYHTENVHDTEAVGSFAHANGGAYNFSTGYGYWIPHVPDELTWSAKSGENGPAKDVAASVTKGRSLAKAPELRQAYENALMEYHGSGLLAKLRSFRDNLADPHNSLAVTLDSIMAQLFGIEGTPWSTKDEYAQYADQIREVAKTWSVLAGRTVMPHEVQAALWVHAKKFIGEQDWGRWEGHRTRALDTIDKAEKLALEGKKLRAGSTFDLLDPAWKEELQFSRDHLAVRTERTPLREQASAAARGKGPPLTPEQADRLAYLEAVSGRNVTQVRVTPDGEPMEWQQRDETYYDANTLRGKEEQYVKYLTNYATPIREAMLAGNFDEARKLLNEFVASRQKSMIQGIDGGAFDEVLRKSAMDEKSVTKQALDRLSTANHVPHPNVEGLTSGELLSKFADRVRGLTMEHPNPMGRIMMRLFQTADFTTMLHEDMHAFRLLAPGDEVAKLSEEYPHIQDATMTPERRADEERFVEDMLAYMHDRARAGDPRLSPAMRSQVKYSGPLHELFNNVADAIDEYSRAALQTAGGHSISNNIIDYWDSIFNQDIVKPDTFHDPLSAQYADENKGVNPKQLRGESDFNYTQRVRQYGEGRERTTNLKQGIAEATRRANDADKFAAKMKSLLGEPTRSEAIASKLQERSAKTLNRIADQMNHPTGNAVPKVWRPFHEAIDRIAEEAKSDPSMAPLLAEIPDNFARMLEFAAQIGFEPAYMPDMTWQMANRYMYGHLTLGENAEESSMRKQNRSVLNKAGITNRSMEALGAASVMAMKELLGSRLVQFVEENYARQWRAGVEIPDGWKPWSATRDAILTGKNIDGKTVAANDTLIVPDAVHSTLRKMSGDPVDMPFRNLWKGGPTAVWKNLILTYSPSWYLKHFIGSTTLAALEGVRMQDWRTAWRQFKNDEYPDVVRGKTIYGALGLDTRTLISRNKITDMPDVWRSEGVRAAAHEVTARLQNVVKTVDSLNRAAVYARTIRLTDNPALAASRAIEALGDFGRLSPLERSAVSSLIPFYSFQKAMFRILIRLPVEHPFVTVAAMQLGLMHQQYLRDKLGGQVPDAYLGAIMLNGKLTPMDKMNPLTDSYKLITPAGIAASLHPFIKPLAEDAFGSMSYGAGAGMSSTGQLQPTTDIFGQYKDMYTSLPALGGSPVNVYSGLSTKQYESLVKRIAKYGKAQDLLDQGGYLVTDAQKPKAAPATAPGGWG